ncbi:MAG: restriction endonuclease subunit S, partial [Bacteroidales bacterium]|nr:restriction endonuclease subunit S [Bacteroidales bacterium]
PWLPKIPQHWTQDKILRRFESFGSGTTPKGEHYLCDAEAEGAIPWINSGDLNMGYLTNVTKYVTPRALQEISALKIYPKDAIIIAMYGASIGKIAISKIAGCTNQACQVLSKPINADLKYLFYQLYSFKDKWSELSFGGTQPNINADLIKQSWIAVPPLEEQQAIAEHLDRKTDEIDELIAIKRDKIASLRDYRRSLIFEAVTGKTQIPE